MWALFVKAYSLQPDAFRRVIKIKGGDRRSAICRGLGDDGVVRYSLCLIELGAPDQAVFVDATLPYPGWEEYSLSQAERLGKVRLFDDEDQARKAFHQMYEERRNT